MKWDPSGVSLESKVKFSKAQGAIGYLISVVFQQNWDVFESSPAGHTFAVGGSVSQVHCKPASCSVFLPTLGKKVSPAISPSRIHTSLLTVRILYACYISHGSQTFLYFLCFEVLSIFYLFFFFFFLSCSCWICRSNSNLNFQWI